MAKPAPTKKSCWSEFPGPVMKPVADPPDPHTRAEYTRQPPLGLATALDGFHAAAFESREYKDAEEGRRTDRSAHAYLFHARYEEGDWEIGIPLIF